MSLLAVLTASVLGSVHCAAMCGPFVLISSTSGRSRWLAHAAYHSGRLGGYLMLGAAAGLLGAGLEHAGALLGAQRAAGVLMGVALLAFALLQLIGWRRGGAGAPSVLDRIRARIGGGRGGPLLLGLFSALLPCGFLWGFVLAAAATGSVAGGARLLAVFWLGTVPILLALGLVARRAVEALRRSRLAPRLAALAMVAIALLAITGRLSPPPCH